jgi:hypothetical protein
MSSLKFLLLLKHLHLIPTIRRRGDTTNMYVSKGSLVPWVAVYDGLVRQTLTWEQAWVAVYDGLVRQTLTWEQAWVAV